jgi:hypothetical protein
MQTIDLSGLHAQSSSPRIDARSANAPRIAPGTFRIRGAGFGPKPPARCFRSFLEGVLGNAVSLAAPDGEIGTFVKAAGGSNDFKYLVDSDGFTALAVKFSRVESKALAIYIEVPSCVEFRLHYASKVPNGWAFAGQTEREVRSVGTSVVKFIWVKNLDGAGPFADICPYTSVGENISISGNSSQPGGVMSAPLVKFDDWWDWHNWNSFGHYQKAGFPNPVTDIGYLEGYASSRITGPTKSTMTKFVSMSAPVHGVGTDIESDPVFNRFYILDYFVEVEQPLLDANAVRNYVSNLMLRDLYISSGTNSYQALFLLNANTLADSSEHTVVHANTWTEGTGPSGEDEVTVDLDAYYTGKYSHIGILRPDKTWDVRTLEACRV